jgi:O-antigen/teichoic acid export membrane protein
VIRRLKASALARNMFSVASGTAAGQLVAFAFSPLITRIFSPEVFGLQGVFLAAVSILSPVIALRYPLAIVIAENEKEARRLERLAVGIAFLLSFILGVILLFAQGPVLAVLGAEAVGPWIWFLPLALLCVAFQDVSTFQATRHGWFRLLGVVTVVQAFLTNLARVLGGLAAPVVGVLIAVTALAPAVQAGLVKLFSKDRRGPPPPQLRPRAALALMDKHRDFPLYRVPTDVLNSASQAVPTILLAALFSPAAAGFYVLARSVLNLPANLVGIAIGNVLYAHYAELDRAGEPLTPVLLRWTGGLLALSPLIIGGSWFAPAIFSFVFGAEWEEAGQYVQWMSLWIGISIANVPAVRLAPAIKSQMLLLVSSGLLLSARAFAIAIAFDMGADTVQAVAAFSIVSLVGNACLIMAIAIAARRYDITRQHETAR